MLATELSKLVDHSFTLASTPYLNQNQDSLLGTARHKHSSWDISGVSFPVTVIVVPES